MTTVQYDFSSTAPPSAPGGGGGVDMAGGPSAAPPSSSWIPSSNQAFEPQGMATAPSPDDPSSAAEGRYKGVHPVAAFFHVAFKALAILLFLIGTLLFSSVVVFILVILLLAMDFWATKNVTGRLLVCLRWWSEVGEDGKSHWIFESSPEEDQRVNSYDRWFFWIVLVGHLVVWVILSIINLMSPARLIIAIIGAVLTWVNVLGYVKCRREKTRLGEFVLQQAAQRPEFVQKAAQSIFQG